MLRSLRNVWRLRPATAVYIAAMGRFPSIDLVLDCMGSICPIHLYYGKRYSRIVFTIEYEGVIIISIDLLRRLCSPTHAIVGEATDSSERA